MTPDLEALRSELRLEHEYNHRRQIRKQYEEVKPALEGSHIFGEPILPNDMEAMVVGAYLLGQYVRSEE